MLENLKWIFVIISSLLILSSCTDNLKGLHQSNTNKVSEMNVNKFKIIDSYSLFEKNGDLIFSINLENNTNNTINFNTNVKPFSIYYNEEQILEAKPYPSFINTVPERIIDIRKGESYKLNYILNNEYFFIDDVKKYQLVYVNHFYDIDSNENIDSNYIKTINFDWEKIKDSNKGILTKKY